MELPPLQNRARSLLFFLFLWAALVAAHLFYYSIWAREKHLEKGKQLSERTGIIPASRGRILDCNMAPIVWNERYYDLYLHPYGGFPRRQKRLFYALHNIIPSLSYVENQELVCLKKSISPKSHIACAELQRSFPEIDLRSRIKRKQIKIPGLAEYIGKVEDRDGILRGISGIEKKYNDKLKGRNGYFSVMVDRLGKWIPGTWEEKQAAKAGEDVVLQISLEELAKKLAKPNKKNATNNNK